MSAMSSVPSTPSLGHTPRSSTAGTVLQTPRSPKFSLSDASLSPCTLSSGLHTPSSSTFSPSAPSRHTYTEIDTKRKAKDRRARRWASQLRVKLEDVFARRGTTATGTEQQRADADLASPVHDVNDNLHHFFGGLQLVAEPEHLREHEVLRPGIRPTRPATPPSRPFDPLDPLVFRYPHSTSVALSEAQIFTNAVPRPRNTCDNVWEEALDHPDAPLHDPQVGCEATSTARRIRREWEESGVHIQVKPNDTIGPLAYHDHLNEIVRQRLVNIHDDIVRKRNAEPSPKQRPRAKGVLRDVIETAIDFLGIFDGLVDRFDGRPHASSDCSLLCRMKCETVREEWEEIKVAREIRRHDRRLRWGRSI